MSNSPAGRARGPASGGSRTGRQHREPAAQRRPYQPPAITFREKLEVFAAVCVPGKADPITCPSGPISS